MSARDLFVEEEEHVTAETLQAILEAVAAGAEVLKTRPPTRLGDWAAEHFYLSPEGSHARGEWKAWPFQVALLDWMGDDGIEELDVQKSKRVGYTKMLLARMAFAAAHERRKLALWQPTDDDRDSFVKSEIEPLLRDVKALHAVMGAAAARDTIKLKTFVGSVWHLLGGKAARAYRRITVAVALLDEIDGFDLMVEKSADPFTLAAGRLEGAPFPKLIAGSTPRIEGASHIARRSKAARAQMRVHVECPHCSVEHPLMWTDNGRFGFVWDTGAPETVRHVCPHCLASISQADYMRIWHGCTWVDARRGYRYGADRVWRNAAGEPCETPRHVAAHVWSAYSPQRRWESIAREFEEAKASEAAGDFGPMQGFRNETLGETWEFTGDKADEHELQRRAADIPLRIVQNEHSVCTLGVDVQGDRLHLGLWAWGRDMRRQLVERMVIYGDPAIPEGQEGSPWAALTEYRTTEIPHVGGAVVRLLCTMIDSGGHSTQAVYAYARAHAAQHVMAIKGQSQAGKPIIGRPTDVSVNFKGLKLKRGVKLWPLGVDTGKAEFYGRLRVQQPGPGFVLLSRELAPECFQQLTSERMVTRYLKGRPKLEWVLPPGRRNEDLDCAVYALAGAHWAGIDRWRGSDWAKVEARLVVERPAAPEFEAEPPKTSQEAPKDAGTGADTAAAQKTPPASPQQAWRGRRQRGRIGGWR